MLKTKMITVTKRCSICSEINTLEVDRDMYIQWQERRILIQDAFPNLSKVGREILMTGTCGGCWENMFSEEEKEDA